MHTLINKLSDLGISLKVNGANLDIFDPNEKLDDVLITEIRQHKEGLINMLSEVGEVAHLAPIPKAVQQEFYPLSSAQQRLYFHYELNKQSTAYNLPKGLWISGELDRNRLEAAFRKVIGRHEILRTTFRQVHDETMQVIHPFLDVEIQFKTCEENAVDPELKDFVHPFDLNDGPLIRLKVLVLESKKHLLLLDMHHIITDGVSQSILIEELVRCYQGETLNTIAHQYRDFSEWQQSDAYSMQLEQQKQFWIQTFEGDIPVLQLPVDFQRKTDRASMSDKVEFVLSKDTANKIVKLAKAQEVTHFMFLLSVYYVLLSRLSGQEEVVVGTPVVGRAHPDLDRTMGVFINTLALPGQINSNKPFSEFLTSVKNHVLNSFQNQYFPYESLIDELNIPRNTQRNPLFDVLFSYQNFENAKVQVEGLQIDPLEISNGNAKLDLGLTVSESNGTFQLIFEYDTSLFERDTIERAAGFFTKIIEELLGDIEINIGAIDLLSTSEKHALLNESNSVASPNSQCLHSIFESKVATLVETDLLFFEGTVLSNRELNQQADQIAQLVLREAADQPIIGLFIEPGIEMVVAALGVIKAGKAFLPLDPVQPSERLQKIVDESAVNCMVTNQDLRENLVFEGRQLLFDDLRTVDEKAPEATASSSVAAYVLFTSGSTGTPKGVQVSHRNLVNYGMWFVDTCAISPTDKLLITSSFAFDAIYTQVLGSLFTGAQLHILDKDTYMSVDKLIAYIENERITFLKMTPSLFNLVIHDEDFTKDHFTSVRMIMLGGEAINVEDVTKIATSHPHIRLMNHYGPTETTIGSIARFIEPGTLDAFVQRPTLGKPIANTQCYVLDREQQLLPTGCIGELHIAGEGVAMGYLNRKDLTEERFVEDPFHSGQIMYRTGDLVSRLPNGDFQYHGRIDDQVKLGGIRIELNEIKNQMLSHPNLVDAQVVLSRSGQQLVGYFTSDRNLEDREVREFLQVRLPEFMVPSFLMRLEAFPLTANGKINKRQLPEPKLTENINEADIIHSDAQKVIASLWRDVLDIDNDRIGIHANFFEIGGNSLKIMKLSRKLQREFQVEISVADLFRYPTIASLDKFISANTPEENNMEERVEEAIDEGSNNLALLNDLIG